MRNIFKTFKENKRLIEENKILKAQNEALTEFRKGFDKFYNDIADVKVITRTYDKKLVLSGTFSLDRDTMYCPTDRCKEYIADHIAKQLVPLIEYDVVDNRAYGTKDMVGRLTILMK